MLTNFSHTSIFDGEYNPYLWPLVAIWGFDRVLRFVRMAYYNIRVKSSRNIIEVTKAVAIYNAESDVITMDVIPGSFLKPKPGQHFFLYQPFTWKGWENHPFTLGAWKSTGESNSRTIDISGSSDDIITSSKGVEDSNIVRTQQLAMDTNTSSTELESQAELHLTFWIRPFDGWTRRIKDKCKSSVDGKSCLKLLFGRT